MARLGFNNALVLNITRRSRLQDPLPSAGNFSFARGTVLATFGNGVSGGVTVAQGPLEAFVMVRIHAGQPTFPRIPAN